MLEQHINAKENLLLHTSRIPANSSHSLHKGTPREAFIKEFLQSHLTELVGFGTGEIIDCNSQPGQQRNQIDIVLYKKNYPKLDFGGNISGFLAEAVTATIEVKSVLTQEELKKSFNSIRNTKSLQRNIQTSFTTGYQAPGILSFIVAYDGPAKMSTVKGWIDQYMGENLVTYPIMPPTLEERLSVQSPVVDLIVILGKGFIQFDNTLVSFVSDTDRQSNPSCKWLLSDNHDGNLLMLFSQLTIALSGVSASWLDIDPYLKSYGTPNAYFEP